MKGQGILMNPFSGERERERGEGRRHEQFFTSVARRQGQTLASLEVYYYVLPMHILGIMNTQYFWSLFSGRSSHY